MCMVLKNYSWWKFWLRPTEISPRLAYKLIDHRRENPGFPSVSLSGKKHKSCASGHIMKGYPRRFFGHTHRGNHVFLTETDANNWWSRATRELIQVIIWGEAYEFEESYNGNLIRGYAVEFLTAAPGYVL